MKRSEEAIRKDPDAGFVLSLESTADAQVANVSYHPGGEKKAPKRYLSAACPTCNYVADQRSKADARQAYVLHRARERAEAAKHPELISGNYPGKLKPYNDKVT